MWVGILGTPVERGVLIESVGFRGVVSGGSEVNNASGEMVGERYPPGINRG